MITRAIGTLTGRQSPGRTLTTVVTLSTDVAANGKFAKGSMVAKILATKTLRDSILGFGSFEGHSKMEKASNSAKRRQQILMVG